MNQPDVSNGDGEDPKVNAVINHCNQCRQEIEKGATICHHCGSNQKRFWQIIKIVPIVIVLLTIVQLALAVKERIETSAILNEVENIQKQAVAMLTAVEHTKNQAENMLSMVETREKHVSERLTDIQRQTNAIENRIESAEQEFTSKQEALTQRIAIVGNDAEKQIEASAKKVSDQVLRSNDRLLKAEKDFEQKNETLTGELHTLKDEVSKELEKLKWRDQLMLLTDEAISYGKRSSFEEIERLVKTSRGTEKEAIVLSYLSQVKRFFINIDRFKSRSITKAGVKIVPNSLSTDVAIIALLNNNEKTVRFKIAKMLSERKELGIPEALLKSVENDECLDVVAQSVKSFETITGFDAPDVFSYVPLLKYWEENKDEVQKNLKKPETKQNNEVKSN